MRKSIILTGAMLALTASFASAAGINLAWDDCGLNGTMVKTDACNSNTGAPNMLVASFVPPSNVVEFLGLSAQIDITSESATLPDWWRHGTGQCRSTTGLSTGFDFTSGPFSCIDFYTGAAAGGFAYDVGYGSPNRARLRIQCAVPFENRGPVSDVDEHYAFRVNLQRAKTTGTGNCAGCNVLSYIVLNSIQLFQPPEQNNDPDIFNPGGGSICATWQAPPGTQCPLSTPTSKASWGQIKSLYR